MNRKIKSSERPAHKEILGKISKARALLTETGYLAADPRKLASNFYELELFTEQEQLDALRAAAAEIRPEYYVGGRPPARSYERATTGADLFAFGWMSEHFERRMYFKFCLLACESGRPPDLYVFSLHEDRSTRTRRKS